MSGCMNAMFLRREAVPKRRIGEGEVVWGRKVVRGSIGVSDGGFVR